MPVEEWRHKTTLQVGDYVKQPEAHGNFGVTIAWLGQAGSDDVGWSNKVIIAGWDNKDNPVAHTSYRCGDDYEVVT